MMVRSLVDEVVRRRLWPIPLLALLVAIAAPLLFMKSAPAGAPDGSAAPPVAAPGELPGSAQKLLTTSDKEAAPKRTPAKKGQDPFAPPKSGAKATGAAADATAASTGAPSLPVVINNSDGSTTTATVTPPASSGSAPAKQATTPKATTPTTKPSTAPKLGSTPKTTTKKPATTPATQPARKVTYVDVRFGARMGTMMRYRIPRLQTFRVAGRVAAMYVGYSRKRRVAVFAIAPSTKVAGDVKCRTVDSVCRYVDLAPGDHARLTLRGEDGSQPSRRLDLVRVRRMTVTGPAKTMPRATSLTTANCLMKRLLALPKSAPSISIDSCD